MMTLATVRTLEALLGRLEGAYEEISKLAAATPDRELGDFKRRLINALLQETGTFLGADGRPWKEFSRFDANATHSDAVLAISQYICAVNGMRVAHAVYRNDSWCWDLEPDGEGEARPPYIPLAKPKVE